MVTFNVVATRLDNNNFFLIHPSIVVRREKEEARGKNLAAL